ncbi:MAG: oxygen-independent coproporphyrinogen III oxidase [Alphaproteobacteria bacterium]|nr:oxygen-independent coproporphyrinogen III oxidase [Alphaproteobacteria bacterium]
MTLPLSLLDARVPRYTSYPTAPHFHPGVDNLVFERWLRELSPDLPLSLYVHMPFCDTLCWFCGCHTTVINSHAPVVHYLADLFTEIGRVASALGAKRRVSHLHFGGGSPTIMASKDWYMLMEVLRRNFEFVQGAEIAVEIDPRGLTDEAIATLAEIGVTRASIGVQDLDEAVQRSINRIQPFACTQSAVDRLRAAGIRGLNIDLVYGLPQQSEAGLAHTLNQVLTLEPDRLAVFGYAHVPHFKKHQNLIDARTLPDLMARARQFELAQRRIAEAGYQPIGLDHFARSEDGLAIAWREGRLRRNFQGYSDDDASALIGFGASAISALPQGYVQNIAAVAQWRSALRQGALPIARGVALSADDRLRGTAIERLMCNLEVDLAGVAAGYGQTADAFADVLPRLRSLAAQGLVEIDGTTLRVAHEMRAGLRLVCAAFDAYWNEGAVQHAPAV